MNLENSSQGRNIDAHDSHRSLLIEQMEERVLFDAVPIAPIDAPLDADLLAQLDSITQALTVEASVGHQQQQEEQPKEIVFVDKSVDGFDQIVAEFIAQRNVEVFFINDSSAGLVQIADHLQGRNDLNAIHIVSHGNDAQLNLGNSEISTASLSSQYLNELVRIGTSLNDSGDILIYGCDLASSASGEAFIKELSQLTNADVAASDDITGAVSDGGDWELEKQTGSIEAQTLASRSFAGRLLVTDAGFTVGTSAAFAAGEIAVVPAGEPGTSSFLYSNAATASGGAISIDVRLTLINTFDELGNVTNGTVDQMPVTFGNWSSSPILLSRVLGSSVSGYEGHTAEILVEFFDNASGNPLSVVGDFTFQDVDFNVPGPGGGSEAVRVRSNEMASYTLSTTPATEIDVIDNGDGTTTFTNDSSAGDAIDQERWVGIEFYDTPSLTLFFDTRNSHTGYGLSTKNFSATPLSFTQPNATDDNFTTDQDTSLAGNVVTANNGNGIDNDPDGDPLSVSLVNGSPANVGNAITGSNGGQFVINSDGSYNFDPNGDFDYLAVGESTTTAVTYEVSDDTGLADTATVTVTVTGTNDAPTPVGTIPDQSGNDGDSITPIDVSGNFADSDTSDTLTFSDGGTLPPGLTINPLTGVISGTIDNSASITSPFAVVITANDGNGGTITQSFTWTVANPAPSASNNSGNVKEDTDLTDSGNVITDDDGSGVDSDPDNDVLFVSQVNGAAGNVGVGLSGTYGSILINATGAYTYTLNNSNPAVAALDNGETLIDSFTYTISDGEGGSSTATVTITIAGTNDAPVIGSTLPGQTDQDATAITPVSVTSAFSDPDGDALTYTASNLPTGLTISPLGLITGTLSPDASQNAPGGVFTVTVTATDDNGASVATTFDWTITNPVPDAVNDSDSTDQATTITGNVLPNDSDPDGDTILVNAVEGAPANVGNVVAGSIGGQFTIGSDGSYTFDPNGDFDYLADGEFASTSVTYSVSDGQGGTDSASLTITVAGTNQDPTVFATIPDQTSADNETITSFDTSTYFSDVDSSDSLSFTALGLPTGLSINPATGQITGTVDSSASLSGPFTVTISAADGNGGMVAQSFNWSITNPAPTATDNAGSVTEDGTLSDSGNIITDDDGFGFDSDPDGDTLTVSSVNGSGANVNVSTAGAYGSIVINSDGTYTYTLDNNNAAVNALDDLEILTESFSYTISDGQGGTSTANITITINGANDDPEIVGSMPNQASLDGEAVATVDVSSFFSDPDGDPLTFSAVGLPPGLTMAANGEITGTLDKSASQAVPGGVFTVTVTATDDNGDTVTDSFTWTVSNPAPTAANNAASVTEDSDLTDSGNVINDNDGSGVDTDPDADPLQVSAVEGNAANVGVTVTGTYGQLVINSNGDYTYTLDNANPVVSALDIGDTLSESFSYTVSDGEGGTSSATLSITINGSNDAPIVGATIPNQFDVDDLAITTLDASTFFSDPDGDTLTFSASGLPAGISIDPLSGEISGTPASSASQGGTGGTYNIAITATDDNGQSVSTTFDWTITNPAPLANDDTFSTDEDTAVSGTVAGNDSDADDTFTFNQLTSPTNGSLTFNSDGSFNYDPDPDFNGPDSFVYQIVDADGATANATVMITVNPINDAPIVNTPVPDQTSTDSDSISLNVAANFNDVDGDGLAFSATGLPTGLSIDASGNITGTIDSSASASGPYTVVVTVVDGNGGSVTDTFTWTVTNPAPAATGDSVSTDEDTPVSGTVATNDADSDGDSLTFAQSSSPANGSVAMASDGTFTYTPDADFNGIDSFDYQVTDADGATATATVTIAVNAINDLPVVNSNIADQANLDSDPISLDVSANFSDVDGDGLTFSATGLPPGLTMDASGNISGTIDSSASTGGPYTVVVTANDGYGGSVTDTFSWNVTNPAPVATDDSFVTSEGVAITDTVATNDNDSDADSLTFVQTSSPSNGTVAFAADGSFTYTPDAEFNGTDSFDYQVTDADGAAVTATVTITVNPVNDPPVVDANIPDQASLDSDPVSLDVSSNFSDVDGDGLTFTATGLPIGLSIDASGNITGTIDSSASASGPYTVVVTVVDGNGGSVTDTFTWTVTNPVPTATNDSFTTDEDTPVSGTVATNDADSDGDSLTFAQSSSPANGSVAMASDGTFTYTPDADFNGTDSFDYQVTDADGAAVTATVTIAVNPVNDLPVVDANIADQANFDSDPISLDISANFSDVDGDGLTFTATGLPTGLSIDASGNITGTIDSSASASGPYTVVVTVVDGNGGSVTDTFTWTVTNPVPTATDDSFTTDEDTPVSGSVSTNDADSDGDSLTFAQSSSPANGSVAMAANGTFTYTPDAEFNGTDSFDYQVTDADGAAVTATVTITVNPVNDLPVVDANIPDQANFDSDPISLDISANFSDVDGDGLTFTATGLPTGLSIDASGNITGTIDSSASASGPFTVVVTVVDGNGGSVTDTFTWTVTNPVPTATGDSFTTDEDTPVSGTVATNDADSDGDSLTFAQSSSPANGSVIIAANGTFTYTPDAEFNGTDSFDYQVTDADGAAVTATVTITVNPVNDLPVVDANIADQANLDSDPISLDISANFSDVDGDGLTFTATGLPPGLAMDASGNITGTIDSSASASGPYTVVVTVVDGNGGSVTDTFTWTVTNPVPTATDDSFTTDEDTPVSGTVATNDADSDGDSLTFAQTSGSANGSVIMAANGTFTYTPDAEFNGTDSFDYQVTDADGAAVTATVTITVNPVNDLPVVDANIADQANFDSDTVSLDVSSNFSDVDGDGLTFTATGLPTGLSIDASGNITGTIDSSASASGPFTVVVTAVDGNGGAVTDTFTWTVNNPVPTATDDSFTTDEDTPVSGTVADNDADSDGDSLTFAQSSSPANGSVIIAANGTFTYTPDAEFNGTDSFDYQVTDADGAAVTATVTITVNPVNDLPVVDANIADQANFDSDPISLDISANFSDVDGDGLTFTATGLPPGLAMDASGNITGTIDSSASTGGPYTVVVTANDGYGGSVTDTFSWNVTNPAPVATDDSFVTSEGVAITDTVATNDNDSDADSLTFVQTSSPSNGTVAFAADGSFTYTPDALFNGADSFDYLVTDADGLTSAATVMISIVAVNDIPVVTANIADQVNFDSDSISLDVSSNFSDPDGDSLTFSGTGLPTGLSLDIAGNISGTIDSSASASGPFTVVIMANDGNGGTVTDTFSWTVTNPAPVANDDAFTTNEDTPVSGSVAGNDSDPDGDSMTFSQATSPSNGSVTFSPAGNFTYTPDSDFHGTDSFDYAVVDADGVATTATISLTVNPVNDPPVVDSPIPDQVNFDSDSISFDVSSNFTDVEGDGLTFSATGLPTGLSMDATGNVTGTIDSNASVSGPFIVVVTVDDGNGGTTTDTFSWIINNPAPVATNNTASTTEDFLPVATGNVITEDSGFGADVDPDGDTLFTSAVDGNAANVGVTIGGLYGTIQINADGSYLYTLDDFNPTVDALDVTETLTESFSYEISDGNGGTSSALLTITINGQNDAPVVGGTIADQANLDTDAILAFDVSGAFGDVDGDPLTYVVSGLPSGLTIDFSAGVISGVIDGNASVGGPAGDGIYNVGVTATDDNGQSVSTTFTWTVDNQVPVAGNDTFTTNEDTPLTSSVTTNDSDPDNDVVSYSITTAPTNGTIAFASDGSFTYTPDADYFGTDTFDYQLCDEDGDCTSATVTIDVVSVNDDPTVVSPIPDQADFDSDLVNLNISSHFSDPEGGSLTFTATGLPIGLAMDVAGNITGTIDSGASASGPYSVVITAEDAFGATVTETFTWNVTNPVPNAVNDSYSTDEDVSLSATVATNDSDPDGDPVTFNLVSGTTNGTLTLNADGSFDYTPNSGFNGLDSFDYEIVDADGDSSSATAVINVGAVNDLPIVTVPIPDQTSLDSDVVSQDISGTFSDPDGDTMTFTATGLPPGLSLNPATGEIVGTIDSSASTGGPYTIVVTADDGNGGTISETFIWTVDNPAPVAGDDNFTTDEEVPVTGTVVGNDNDADGDSVTYALTNGPANGIVSLAADGSFTYTPNLDFFGVDSFEYEACDADGACAVATVTVTVDPVNDTPATVTPIPNQASLDSDLVSVDVSGFFGDVDGDLLTFSANNLPTGLAISPSGLISGTIDSSASQSGPFTVEITVADGNGGTVGQFFTWNVSNPAPTAGDDAFTTDEDAAVSGSVTPNDSDLDGDVTDYSLSAAPADGTVSFNSDGTFTYTPDADFYGIDTFTYEMCDVDGACTTAIVTITVNSVNDAPNLITPVADQTSFDSDVIVLDLSSSFSDPENDSLTFTETGLPPGLSLNPVTGIISGTIDSSASTAGPYSVVITVDDGNGDTATDTFTWSVANPAPIAIDDTFATSEDVPLTGTVATNDSDADDGVTFSLAALPSNGVIVFNSDGSFTYTPDVDYIGFDSFEYELCDSDGACVTATATIAIGPVNDPPVVASPLADQVNLDSESVALDAGSSFTDPEGDVLTFSAIDLPPGLNIDPFTGVISGVIDSSASVVGTYLVVVTANDGNGGVTTDTFTWTISNPLPIAQNDNFSTPEDTTLASSIAGNDIDPDGDLMSFNLASGPANGLLTFNSDGTFNYTPDSDFFGTDSFTYQVTDFDGDTTTAVATINITPVNDGPIAMSDAALTAEETPVNIAVLVNDVDPENDALTVTITSAPANGVVNVNPDGSIDYTPDKDFNGTDTFEYEICDTGGLCSTATVSVSVNPVNDAPIANDDNFTTIEDTTIVGTLVANDSDPDGDPLTYSLVTPPAQGTLTLNPDGTFVYSPAADFNGTVTFAYQVADPSGASDTGLATISVTPENDPPVAIDDADNTSEDTVVTINLLGNDFDPESDTLSVTHINGVAINVGETVGLPSGATVTLKAGGIVDYDPNMSFEGLADGSSAIDSFLYTVSDGKGGNATAETVVTVNGDNDPPVAEDDYVKVTVDTAVTFTVLANDNDPEGDPLAVVLLNNPVGGTASVNPEGTISFVPDSGFEGMVHIHYLVEDPSGATSEATLTIEVEPEFRFDSFTNFSISHMAGDHVNRDSRPIDRALSKQIFSLAPEPIFSGYARPGTQIIGRIYDASGSLVGEGRVNTDPGGNWLMQFQGTRGHQFYRVEFDQVAAVGTADIYGYFGLHPADNSYQTMEALTSYDNPLSVDVALFDSFLGQQQADQQANNPLGFGRPEATQ